MRASHAGDRAAILVLRFLLLSALAAGVLALEHDPPVPVSRFVLAVGDALLGAPPAAGAAPVVARGRVHGAGPSPLPNAIGRRDEKRAGAGARVPEVEPLVTVRVNRAALRPGEVIPEGDDVRRGPAIHPRAAPIELPGSWQLEGGRYAGREVELDPEGAVRGMDGRTSGGGFWRLMRSRDGGVTRVVAWAVDSLPVRLVLERGPGSWLSAHDSLVVWALVGELEDELGMHLFRPANPEEVGARAPLADGVRVRVSATIGAAGRTYLSYDQDGRIGDAVVSVASRDLLGDRRVLKHELLHALGFGHTAAWPSLLSRGGSEVSATAQDAAHARAWYAVRAAQERGGVLRVPAAAR